MDLYMRWWKQSLSCCTIPFSNSMKTVIINSVYKISWGRIWGTHSSDYTNTIFQDVTPCNLIEIHQHFAGISTWLHSIISHNKVLSISQEQSPYLMGKKPCVFSEISCMTILVHIICWKYSNCTIMTYWSVSTIWWWCTLKDVSDTDLQ
jgi:hypothetical protein